MILNGHVTLKTGVMAAENPALPSHEKMTLKIILKLFYALQT